MSRADAWNEGYDAYKSGLSYFDNAYVNIGAAMEPSMSWSAGWKFAYQMNKGT